MIPSFSSDARDPDQEIEALVKRAREWLGQGKDLPSDEALAVKFPHLMPKLAQAMQKVRVIADAQNKAERGVALTESTPAGKGSSKAAERREEVDSGKRGTVATDGGPLSAHSKRSSAASPNKIRYFGDYELLEELGRGGMGVVYKARQVSLDRLVAVKMILSGSAAEKEDVERFHREAKAAAKLKHPNIVEVYETGKHDGKHYFSMAYIDGRSLSTMCRNEALPSREAAAYVAKLAAATAYAHEQGVVHRDLKPGNVLIDRDNEPHITDFGLAKRIDADSKLTVTGKILGTPSYMSPEQALGDQADVGPPSDIYALGAILYCLVTGRPPLQGESPVATMMQVIKQEPVTPRELNPGIDLDLETICLKCLEKERAARYESAGELHEELKRYERGEPIKARPVSLPSKTWRWCKRNRLVAALTAAVFLVLLLGIAAATTFAVVANRNSNLARQERKRADEQAELAKNNEAEALKEKNTAEKLAEAALEEKQRADAAAENAQQQAHIAAVRQYSAQVSAAQSAWQAGNTRIAWEYLDSCRWDLRGWEHDYLYTLFNQNQLTFRGHLLGERGVNCVAFSPDGQKIVSSGLNLSLWDSTTANELLNFHSSSANCAAFSPDGLWVVSGKRNASNVWPDDNAVIVWNVTTGKRRLTLLGHKDEVTCVAYSPDGRRIVSGGGNGDRTVKVWDATTGKEIHSFMVRHFPWGISSVAFSPDGSRCFSATSDMTITIWDSTTGKELLKLEGLAPEGVTCSAFSPDLRKVVSASLDKTVKVWDTATGNEIRHLSGHTEPVYAVAFSPDSKQIVSGEGGNGTLRIWDAETGHEIMSLKGHTASITGVAFGPDGSRIVSTSSDSTAKVWNIQRGQIPNAIRRIGSVNSADFSLDGRRIVVSDGGTARVLKSDSGEEMMTLSGHAGVVKNVKFSSDGKWILAASETSSTVLSDGKRLVSVTKEAKVWDATTGEETFTIKDAYSPSFSPDSRWIVCGDAAGHVTLWDTRTGEATRTFEGHTNTVYSVTFSPDARRIVSGSGDTTVKLWDVTTGRILQTMMGHTAAVSHVMFHSDGHRILSVVGKDGTLKTWESTTGKEMFTLNVGYRPAISPDGNRIVSTFGNSAYRSTRVLDITSGKDIRILSRLKVRRASSLGFSPDGRRVVSAGYNGTTVWDATTGEEMQAISSDDTRLAVFSPNGDRIASGGTGGIEIWNATQRQHVLTPEGLSGAPSGPAKFSLDGRKFVSGGSENKVMLWDTETGQELLALKGHSQHVTSVAFSPDGQRIVSASGEKTVKVWDATTGEERLALSSHTEPVYRADFSPDGRKIISLSSDYAAKVWNATTGEEIFTIQGVQEGEGCELAFSPDGKRIASTSLGNAVKLFDADSGKEVFTLKGHTDAVFSVVFSADGRRIASGSRDNTVKIWDARTGMEILTLNDPIGSGFTLTFSPDGKLIVSMSAYDTMKVWDVTTGDNVFTSTVNLESHVTFSPDGKWIVAGADGGRIRVWDAMTWLDKFTLYNNLPVTSVNFSPNGQWIASGGSTPRLWDFNLLIKSRH